MNKNSKRSIMDVKINIFEYDLIKKYLVYDIQKNHDVRKNGFPVGGIDPFLIMIRHEKYLNEETPKRCISYYLTQNYENPQVVTLRSFKFKSKNEKEYIYEIVCETSEDLIKKKLNKKEQNTIKIKTTVKKNENQKETKEQAESRNKNKGSNE